MPEIGVREKISGLVKMFIFTLQSSQLSVCVGLRSTDLVMNNLFHAGNTLWKTQQTSVETLQSTDWGVSNYNFTTLWSSKRSTVSTTHPPLFFFFQKMSLSSAGVNRTDTNQAFYAVKDAAQKPAESVLQNCSTARLHHDGLPQFARVLQVYDNSSQQRRVNKWSVLLHWWGPRLHCYLDSYRVFKGRWF